MTTRTFFTRLPLGLFIAVLAFGLSACDSTVLDPPEEPEEMNLVFDHKTIVGEVQPYDTVSVAVKLVDGEGEPVSGKVVNWYPAGEESTAFPLSSETDADGYAVTQWVLGPAAGTHAQEIGCSLEEDDSVFNSLITTVEKGSLESLTAYVYDSPVSENDRTSILVQSGTDEGGNKVTKEELEEDYFFSYKSTAPSMLTVKEGEGGEGDLVATIYTHVGSERSDYQGNHILIDAARIGTTPDEDPEGRVKVEIIPDNYEE